VLTFLFPGQGRITLKEIFAFVKRDESLYREYLWLFQFLFKREWEGQELNELEDNTSNLQPAIIALQLALYNRLSKHGFGQCDLLAGHSLGEISVLSVCQSISREAAILLTAYRAELCEGIKTKQRLYAVLSRSKIQLDSLETENNVIPALYNSPFEIVVAADQFGLETLNNSKKFKVLPLLLSAFHTEAMSSVAKKLEAMLSFLPVINEKTSIPVLLNANALIERDSRSLIKRVVNQIKAPVRWNDCMERLVELGVTGCVEFPVGNRLSNLLRQIEAPIEFFSFKDSVNIEAFARFYRKHKD
jgi:[acyl-carrier-protein] S-malonyltransferase